MTPACRDAAGAEGLEVDGLVVLPAMACSSETRPRVADLIRQAIGSRRKPFTW